LIRIHVQYIWMQYTLCFYFFIFIYNLIYSNIKHNEHISCNICLI
jgi:hypothetical protein